MEPKKNPGARAPRFFKLVAGAGFEPAIPQSRDYEPEELGNPMRLKERGRNLGIGDRGSWNQRKTPERGRRGFLNWLRGQDLNLRSRSRGIMSLRNWGTR